MSRKNRRKRSASPRSRTLLTILIALVVFGVLGTTPLILKALNLHIQPVAAKSGYGVTLLPAPTSPSPVPLPPVARPIDPMQPPASLPAVDPAREAALVSAEDARIRILLHDAVRVYQPEVLPIRASLPTLVLTATSHAYTATDLANYGALVMLKHHAALLIDNVFVSTNARLSLGSARLRVLYMDSSTGGFASIVGWGGDMAFQGTPTQPFTITGWDRVAKAPAKDQGNGRSYIRDVGGKMTFTNVRVSSLGFWSGRTGGVAWTGVNGQPSTGGATSSTFTNDTYGAFVARGQNIKFTADLFEFNQLDGLHIHRYSIGTSVISSSSSRNGGNGFLIDRATQSTLLRHDVSQNNEGNGYFIDGLPLVNGASASGSAVQPGSGATIERSAALDNDRTGILVEGGTGTVLRADQVCATITGIAARYHATDTVITGNDVRCSPRSGLSIGPAAPGAIISGNSVSGARIAMLVRSSGRIEVDNNLITGATVFGITARGLNSQVNGVGNVISGTGFRAVDARADARQPALSGTNTTRWLHHVKITFWSYLQFHPLAALWLSILVLVLACYLWSRRRRMPPHPYPASTHWRPAGTGSAQPDLVIADPEPVFAGAAAGAGSADFGARTSRAGVGQPLTIGAEWLDLPAASASPGPATAQPSQPMLTPMSSAQGAFARADGGAGHASSGRDGAPCQPTRASPPRASPPRASAPRASAPRASAPRASAPRASAPRASAPRASAPRASAPRASAPRASAPRASAPRASAPRASPADASSGRGGGSIGPASGGAAHAGAGHASAVGGRPGRGAAEAFGSRAERTSEVGPRRRAPARPAQLGVGALACQRYGTGRPRLRVGADAPAGPRASPGPDAGLTS